MKKSEELMAKYRSVFINQKGLEVLSDILFMCHFGDTLKDEHMLDEYNIGVGILAKLGIFSEGTRLDVVSALASVSPKPKEPTAE